ncbi:cellulose biosynthesis protein BcsC [Martelella alba]|uniref:Tetratricopeptide repeat protein n=1 Tax=Martelella alba TaxID=2590451 RepID=A0ABY2SH55_9HYPH|nr:cellulose biosynthesis protein BcsC [Martelella alba]TKI04579.1 tetratricopeptide repeat protein [Martelella alba]
MNKTLLAALTRTACCGLLLGGAWPAQAQPVISALLQQANYWHGRAHDDKAREALQKILTVDGNNADALFYLALYAAQDGNTAQALYWRRRLETASPSDPRLASLSAAAKPQAVSAQQLAQARQLARQGDSTAAVAAYRRIFGGDRPTEELATEYYQTLAGVPGQLPQAIAGLREQARMFPGDNTIARALGRTLTYTEATRREGIGMLAALADKDTDADKALRQALLWLEAGPGDRPLYQAWASRHPADGQPMAHFQQAIAGQDKKAAYDALNQGNTALAAARFDRILQANPHDAEALAGRGYAALRAGDYAAATRWLNQAATDGGSDGSRWRQQAQDADFYARLATAREAARAGDTARALSLVEPLQNATGEQGVLAGMLKADLLRRRGDIASARVLLQRLHDQSPAREDVSSALYYVLRQQGENEQAQKLLGQLSAQTRQKLRPADDPAEALRRSARQASDAGNDDRAEALLRQARARSPDNVWVTLDLARLLRRRGDTVGAEREIASLAGRRNDDAVYAAALDAADQQHWRDVLNLLNSRPSLNERAVVKALRDRAAFNLQLAQADDYSRAGNNAAAINTLRPLLAHAPTASADIGKLAQSLMNAGDMPQALQLVRQDMARGLHGSVGDYAGHIAVLNSAGRYADAESLLSDPSLQNGSNAADVRALRNGSLIAEADALRQQGRIRQAYQRLAVPLRDDPGNENLLLAMNRVYMAGDMLPQSTKIINYLQQNHGDDPQVIRAGVELALARRDGDQAGRLLTRLPRAQQPEDMLLAARVAELNGENRKALALLESAQQNTAQRNDFAAAQDAAAPGLLANGGVPGDPDLFGLDNARGTDKPDPATAVSRDISRRIDALRDKLATWAQGGIEVRNINGESGLGRLTEVAAPLSLSGVPGDSARWEFKVRPLTLYSGQASGEVANRFGAGALVHAERQAADDDDNNADATDTQQASGTELNFSVKNDLAGIDIGSTPLGQPLATAVGGLTFSPQLSEHSRLTFTAERRAVTDSLLSYIGSRDPVTGKRFGAVTRNGADAQLAWDNGYAGAYLSGGYYRYLGRNVVDNDETKAGGGFYLRPYRTDDQELKTGIDIDYMNFKKNLSYYSLGQGGYFSPQNYLSVSAPVTFTQHFDKGTISLGGAIGYQTYREKSSDIFPGQSQLQQEIESYASEVDGIDSQYAEQTKHGVSYRLNFDARYAITDDSVLGLNLGYSTFGNYNESSALFYLKYTPSY